MASMLDRLNHLHRSNVRLLDRAATGATYILGPYCIHVDRTNNE